MGVSQSILKFSLAALLAFCTPAQQPSTPPTTYPFLRTSIDEETAKLLKQNTVRDAFAINSYAPLTIDWENEHAFRELVNKEITTAIRHLGLQVRDAYVEKIDERTLLYPEQDREAFASYAAYARNIIDYANTQLGMFVPVSIGGAEPLALPAMHICRFLIDERIVTYTLETAQGLAQRTTTIIVPAPNSRVEDLLDVDYNAQPPTLDTSKPRAVLCTGSAPHHDILAPLSEYLPILLRDGIQKHYQQLALQFRPFTKDHVKFVMQEVIVGSEAVTEALATALVLDYHRNRPLPDSVVQAINANLDTLAAEQPRYALAPTCYRLVQQDGVEPVVRAYLDDPKTFIDSLRP